MGTGGESGDLAPYDLGCIAWGKTVVEPIRPSKGARPKFSNSYLDPPVLSMAGLVRRDGLELGGRVQAQGARTSETSIDSALSGIGFSISSVLASPDPFLPRQRRPKAKHDSMDLPSGQSRANKVPRRIALDAALRKGDKGVQGKMQLSVIWHTPASQQ